MHRFIPVLAVAVLLLLTCFGEAEKPAGGLTVGFAERDITPEVKADGKPVWVAGFGNNRRATGVNDPIMARAVVLSDGVKKIALVSVDLVGLFLEPVEKIRQGLPGFEYICISSTHNHEGPDTLGLWGRSPLQSGVDPEYLLQVEKGVQAAVRAADAARVAASGRIGTIKAPELLHDSRIPIVKHDDLVTVAFRSPAGKMSGLIVQWNCHPETLDSKNTLLSADYVGYTVEYLRKKYDCPVVYLTGTVGGLMTSLRVPIKSESGEELRDGTFEKTRRYGELLGMAAVKAVDSSVPAVLTPIVARTRTLHVPLANKLYVAGRQMGVFSRNAYRLEGGKPVLTNDIDAKQQYSVRTELGYLRLGELEVACIPGEIYPELVLGKVVEKAEPGADFPDAPAEPAIYDQFKSRHRMLIGLANDEIGYIIPKRQWDEKPPYCYGRTKSQYGEINSLGPETAPLLCRAFADLVAGK
jgi:hypothetical protein